MQALVACNRCLFTSPFCPASARKNSFNQTMSFIATSFPGLDKRCMLRSEHVIRCCFVSGAGARKNKSWELLASLKEIGEEMEEDEMGEKMGDEMEGEMGDEMKRLVYMRLVPEFEGLDMLVEHMNMNAIDLDGRITCLEAENKELKEIVSSLDKKLGEKNLSRL